MYIKFLDIRSISILHSIAKINVLITSTTTIERRQ